MKLKLPVKIGRGTIVDVVAVIAQIQKRLAVVAAVVFELLECL